DPSIHPAAGENCGDGVDNNCDGQADAADLLCPGGCGDADGDGYADESCGGSDCRDDRGDINPGQPELCTDGLDNDCDRLVDVADTVECTAGCPDGDGDGYLDASCGGADCDDTNGSVFPTAGEHCSDGVDNNCDTLTDS